LDLTANVAKEKTARALLRAAFNATAGFPVPPLDNQWASWRMVPSEVGRAQIKGCLPKISELNPEGVPRLGHDPTAEMFDPANASIQHGVRRFLLLNP
jgi:hypothetical protein